MSFITTILLVPHIIAAGAWITEEVIVLIMERLIKRNRGTASELTLIGATLTLNGTLGQAASSVILITGALLTWTNQWAILGIGAYTPPWLIIKQVVYILITLVVIFGIIPNSRRLGAEIKTRIADGVATEGTRALAARAITLGHVHSLLVLINIILAVWKPTF